MHFPKNMGVGEVFRNSAGLLRNKTASCCSNKVFFMESAVKHTPNHVYVFTKAESPKQLLARKVSQEQGKLSGNFHAVLPPHKGT